MSRRSGVELRARLVADRNLGRAARLLIAGEIGSESGVRGTFSPERWEKHLRDLEERVRAYLRQEAARSPVPCHWETGEGAGEAGGADEQWVLGSAGPALGSGEGARSRVYVYLAPTPLLRVRSVVALVALAPPSEGDLRRARDIARWCGHEEPLWVFSRSPLRHRRELGEVPGVIGFSPVPDGWGERMPDRLVGELARHGASMAVLLVPDAVSAVTGRWGQDLMRRSPLPVVFLQAE
jgi:hypothetical protein